MNISPIKPGDLIRCDVRGDRFVAEVTERVDGGLKLAPVGRSFLPAYHVGARQVVAHWRKSKRSK